MSWASSRITKRSEDRAYCLLGIFQVNMTMQYGEGGTRAFYRLQEEIMKQSRDQTIFTWCPPMDDLSKTTSVLADSPRAFRNGSTLAPIPHRDDFEMTNRGLKTTTRLLRLPSSFAGARNEQEILVLLMNCIDTRTPQAGQLSVFVQRAEGEELFTRLSRSPFPMPIKYLGSIDSAYIPRSDLINGLQNFQQSWPKMVNASRLSRILEENQFAEWHGTEIRGALDTVAQSLFEVEKFEQEVRSAFQTLQNYMEGIPRTIYITHLAKTSFHKGPDLVRGCFKPLMVYASRASGRSSFEVRYLHYRDGDSAISSGIIAYEDEAHEFSLAPHQMIVAHISEPQRSDLRPFLSPGLVAFKHSLDANQLEIVSIRCQCRNGCLANLSSDGTWGILDCAAYGLRLMASIQTTIFSTQVYTFVGISISAYSGIADDRRSTVGKVWDSNEGSMKRMTSKL